MSMTTRNRRKKTNRKWQRVAKIMGYDSSSRLMFNWWGHSTIDREQWEKEARSHCITSFVKIDTFEEANSYLLNGYLVR